MPFNKIIVLCFDHIQWIFLIFMYTLDFIHFNHYSHYKNVGDHKEIDIFTILKNSIKNVLTIDHFLILYSIYQMKQTIFQLCNMNTQIKCISFHMYQIL